MRARTAPSGMPFYPMDAFGRLSHRNRRNGPGDCTPCGAASRTSLPYRTAHAEAAWRGVALDSRAYTGSARKHLGLAFFVLAGEEFMRT